MFSSFSKILQKKKTKRKGAVVRSDRKQPFMGSGSMTTRRRKKLLNGPGSLVFPGYSTTGMADWASLPRDVLGVIAEHVKKIPDLSAFGTVCKSWHAAATKDHFKALWLRELTPFLMLPLRDGNTRDLYSLADGEIVASFRVPNVSQRKCYESLGWFLAVEEDGGACLLDPFSSRPEIQLPHLKNLPYSSGNAHVFVKKMVLSARPTDPSDPSNFVVALIFRSVLGVAFWKPGDKSWHLTWFENLNTVLEDITYHAGSFYVFDDRYQVTSFNILNGFPEVGQVIAPYREPCPLQFGGINVYLVKMAGSLLLVSRTVYSNYGNPYRDLEERYRTTKFEYRTVKFEVYEFQFSSNTWRKTNNLGNMALFLGSDIATTIVDSSRFPGFVKPNHIYFTDDGERNPFNNVGKPGKAVTGQDMGVYNLGNGRIDPFYHGEAFNSTVSHPTWILPFLWSSTTDEMHTL